MPVFTSVYEDTSPFLVYNGEWGPGTSGDSQLSQYTAASFMGTSQNEATLSFQYYGTRVSILGAKRANHGRYQVTVDGQVYPEGNGTARPDVFKDTLFVENLNQGLHSVQLVNREDAWLDVDQVSWTTSIGTENEELIVNTIQDSHPRWVYQPSDSWLTTFPEVGTFSGGSGHGTSRQQATAELTFAGDCIALFGGVGSSAAGAYSVQVDDRAAQRFTALQDSALAKQLLYWAGGLGTGNHTIRVRMDSPVANQMLTIDYAEVYTTPSLGGSWEGSNVVAAQPSARASAAASSSKPTGMIVGIGVVSAIAGLALLGLLALIVLARRRKRLNEAPPEAHPQSQPYGGPIQPFVTSTNGHPSSTHVPFMSSTSGDTASHAISATGTQGHGLGSQASMAQLQHSQYPVGMIAAVNQRGQPQGYSEGDVASSSGTAISAPVPTPVSHKATEAARHRVSSRSEAPPAYNPS